MDNKEAKRPTSNVQRPTSNGTYRQRPEGYNLESRLLNYAVRIIRLVDSLPSSRSGDHIGGQLLRSGTSPTLHHGEVEAAESTKDFIHKLKICLKELKESRRALLIIQEVPLTKQLDEVRALSDETAQLIRIFFASIRTAQRRLVTPIESSVVREDSPLDGHAALDISDWVQDVLNDAIAETEGEEK